MNLIYVVLGMNDFVFGIFNFLYVLLFVSHFVLLLILDHMAEN